MIIKYSKNKSFERWLVRFSPALFTFFLMITVFLTSYRSVSASYSLGAFTVGILLSIPLISFYVTKQTVYAMIYGAGVAGGFYALNTLFGFFDAWVFIAGLFAGLFLPMACGRGKILNSMLSLSS